MSRRRTVKKDDGGLRFALVPHPGCVCERCLMHASRGFDYTYVFDPHGPGRPKCKCRFVPGVKGVTKVEGYDPDECYRAWKDAEISNELLDAIKPVGDAVSLAREKDRLKASLNELSESMRKAKRKRSGGSEEYWKLRKEWDELKKDYDAIEARLATVESARAEAVRLLVSKVRKLGPETGKTATDYLSLKCGEAIAGIVERAVRFIPTDWLEKMRQSGVSVRLYSGKGRSHYDISTKTLQMKAGVDELTVVHELMHAMDGIDSAFFDDSKAFFLSRTNGKTLKTLRSLTGNKNYKRDEFAYDMSGECVDPYVYKEYADGNGALYAFEVASMGVEYLYRNPLRFKDDFEHLMFVIGKLRRF